MAPKLAGTVSVRTPDFVVTLREPEGCPYWARLKILKASARKITLFRWVRWKFFSTAESSCHNGGPVMGLRPAFPQAPTAGREKAAGLIQCEMLRLPRYKGTPDRKSTRLNSSHQII